MTFFFDYLTTTKCRAFIANAERQNYFAEVAQLNWRIDTSPLIQSEMKGFFSHEYGRSVVMTPLGSRTTIQLDLHTDNFYSTELGSNNKTREGPASLVYSLHPNGSVVVIASPHSSAHTSKNSQHYILDVVPHVWLLAGNVGRAKVRRHLRIFGKLAVISRTVSLPSQANGKFLISLVERGDRFESVFQSTGEAKRHRLSQESNLGIGLVAGLMASTILPFARDFGVEIGKRAVETKSNCLKSFVSEPRITACIKNSSYQWDTLLSSFLSTGSLLIFSLLLTFAGLLILLRIKRLR